MKTKRLRTFSDAFRLYVSNQQKYLLGNGVVNATAIAEDLEVTPRTVNKILNQETYSPKEPFLIKMCEVFGVSLYQITGFIPFEFEGREYFSCPICGRAVSF